jgi:hypothetical protein
MKIVYNTWFPFGRYSTLNFFGILFTKRKQLPETVINHESIHTAQMKEMLWIFFYLWYGIEYIFIRLFHKKQNCAYHDISFEEEAYSNEKDLNYLKTRKHYAWWKYIRPRSIHK